MDLIERAKEHLRACSLGANPRRRGYADPEGLAIIQEFVSEHEARQGALTFDQFCNRELKSPGDCLKFWEMLLIGIITRNPGAIERQ